MTNIAVITKVEYDASGVFTPIPFQAGSAAYEDKRTTPAAGPLYRHTLKFKISNLTELTGSIINEICSTTRIRFIDVNGVRITIGSSDLPVKIETERGIDGKAGSYRGYTITVKWDSTHPAPTESFI